MVADRESFVKEIVAESTTENGVVNLFALMPSPRRGMGGIASPFSQAATAGTVISRQLWSLCFMGYDNDYYFLGPFAGASKNS
jgi:hypothetical protein